MCWTFAIRAHFFEPDASHIDQLLRNFISLQGARKPIASPNAPVGHLRNKFGIYQRAKSLPPATKRSTTVPIQCASTAVVANAELRRQQPTCRRRRKCTRLRVPPRFLARREQSPSRNGSCQVSREFWERRENEMKEAS